MGRLTGHLRRNVIGYLALFFALGGIAGAAVQPLLDKPGSVKGRHVARGAIHMSDLARSVRDDIAIEPLPDGNYTGEATDGSFSISAVVKSQVIVAMSVTGDCAFPAADGTFDQTNSTWFFVPSVAGHITVLGLTSGDSIYVSAVLVEGANKRTCRGPVELIPA